MQLPCLHLLYSKSYLQLKLFLEKMDPIEVNQDVLSNPNLLLVYEYHNFIICSSWSIFLHMKFISTIGALKLAQIRENSNFFRSELQKMGFEVLGDNDSPVMPIMLYNPAKIPAFSRECLRQKVSMEVPCLI